MQISGYRVRFGFQELEKEKSKLEAANKHQRRISSLVWLVAGEEKGGKGGGGSVVDIMDGCEPSKKVDSFKVGSNNTSILCITSVPGMPSIEWFCIVGEIREKMADIVDFYLLTTNPLVL